MFNDGLVGFSCVGCRLGDTGIGWGLAAISVIFYKKTSLPWLLQTLFVVFLQLLYNEISGFFIQQMPAITK